jgi:hypothetical protein
MSYLTRLSQQTGLAPVAPQIQPAESSPAGLHQVEEFVAPAPLGEGRSVDSPIPVSPPLRTTALASNPSPSSPPFGSQPPLQPSAPLDFPPIAAPVQPGPEPTPAPSNQGLPAPRNSGSEGWLGTDSAVTVQFPSPEVVTNASQPSVMLPEVTVERSQATAHEMSPAETFPPPAMIYLQTLQTVRDWVSAPLEESHYAGTDTHAEAVSVSGLPQAIHTSPATVQVINPAELGISSDPPLNLGHSLLPWDMAANSTPFPAESATTISIGSIQVVVEGPPAPPAPAPAQRSESPRPSVRLSRHYLRLR